MSDTNSNYQIELGKLLQKERSEEARIEVNNILSEKMAIVDKIIKIKALDNGPPPLKPKTEKASTSDNNSEEDNQGDLFMEKTPYISKKDLELVDDKPVSDTEGQLEEKQWIAPEKSKLREIEKARRTLKIKHERVPFFRFFFKEQRRIKLFGHQTGILYVPLLSTQVKMNPEIAAACSKIIQKRIALSLLNYLSKIQNFSWEILKKQEYNNLALLRKLCRAVMDINFTVLNIKDRNFIDRLRLVETLFLTCYTEKDFINLCINAISKITDSHRDQHKSQSDPSVYVKRLLSPEGSRPSLYYFLLSANIVKYRKFLTFDDLIIPTSVPLVSTTDFDCSEEIFKKIQERISALEKEIKPLLDIQKQIMKTKSFIPSNEHGAYDFSLLKYFYDFSKGDPSFDKDSSKINIFIPSFVKFYHRQVRSLLDEPVEVEDREIPFRVFETFFFRSDWDRFQLQVNKLEKIEMSITSFTLERFYKLLESPKGAISIELEMISVINNILDMIFRFSELLVSIIQQRMETTDNVDSPPPITRAAIQQNAFFIPFEHRKIINNDFFEGKTVGEALMLVTQLGYLFGLYLKDSNLTEILKKENRIKQKVIYYTKTFKRLASVDQFISIKKKFDLPTV